MAEHCCEHCGERIIQVNYALGPKWMHQRQGASGLDDVHEYCYITPASPKYETPLTLTSVVMTFDPMKESDIQPHIRPILDALNSVPNFVRGEAFVISLDNGKFDNNEVKLMLEFETRNHGNTE